jgi:putative transposase
MSVVEEKIAIKVNDVRKLRLGGSKQLNGLCRESGRLYSLAAAWFWRHVRRNGIWLSQYSMQRRLTNGQPTILHSQSAQKAIECFFHALKTWRTARKENPDLRPPHKQKKFYKVVWKKSAIRIVNGDLVLSNALRTDPVVIPGWSHEKPVQAEIGWNGKEYELRATYEIDAEEPEPGIVASCDLGEVHPAVVGTEDFHLILNGGELRSKRRYREKLKAEMSAIIDRKKKGGKRRAKIIKSKQKKLRRIDNQITDLLHKLTSYAINTLHERGVREMAIGDLRDIRVNNDKGAVQNQRLHQAPTGKTRHMLTYKGDRRGWKKIEPQEEAWTSQECLQCSALNKPNGRVYRCSKCGFECHRDVVGQMNILRKYLGNDRGCRVVGAMASPIGVRYVPHLRCCS